MHCWLMNNKYFGKYLHDYTENKGMPPRAKAVSILFVWGGILLSIVLFVRIPWAIVLMLAVAVGVTIHLLRLKTLKEERIS